MIKEQSNKKVMELYKVDEFYNLEVEYCIFGRFSNIKN